VHDAHALLVLATATFLVATGVVILALGWRRAYRHESSGLLIGTLTQRQTVVSYLAVPAFGLAALVVVVVGAAVLR
jgi:hypothetical protein